MLPFMCVPGTTEDVPGFGLMQNRQRQVYHISSSHLFTDLLFC